MWIIKNSKQLIEILTSKSVSSCNSIKTFNFSTLYTSFPHEQLKSRLAQLIRRSFFFKKNRKRRYKYLVVDYTKTYFVINESKNNNKFTEDQIIDMLNFLIDNIFVQFGGRVFQQTIGIPMGTNCAPLLADLFLHSYEADFLQWLLDKKDRKLALSFNLTFRYIDDVLSLNNPRVGDFLHLVYPKNLW